MAGRLWKREQHVRRLIHRRRKHHIRPYFGYGEPPDVAEAWPRRQWTETIGVFQDHHEAQVVASRHPGSVLETVLRYRGKRTPRVLVVGYRVGYAVRLGAPFRKSAMTWELENATSSFQDGQARQWLKKGSLKGGSAPHTRVSRRRWRRAGRAACLLALRGEIDAADTLDPQPMRLGVMWMVW